MNSLQQKAGIAMEWNVQQYDQQHDFVTTYGKDLLTYLPSAPSKVLDIGCGTGGLTQEIAQQGHRVTGIDPSATMIQQAQALFPDVHFQQADILDFHANNSFDVLFSNAVFHWIPQQEALLQHCRQILKTGGTLLCEFGAQGNIQQIERAFIEELHKIDVSYHSPFFFPSVEEYRVLLGEAGFEILHLVDYDRPTVLKDQRAGLRHWMAQFFADDLEKLSAEEQTTLFQNVEKKLEKFLWKADHWEADYRRLQFVAKAN